MSGYRQCLSPGSGSQTASGTRRMCALDLARATGPVPDTADLFWNISTSVILFATGPAGRAGEGTGRGVGAAWRGIVLFREDRLGLVGAARLAVAAEFGVPASLLPPGGCTDTLTPVPGGQRRSWAGRCDAEPRLPLDLAGRRRANPLSVRAVRPQAALASQAPIHPRSRRTPGYRRCLPAPSPAAAGKCRRRVRAPRDSRTGRPICDRLRSVDDERRATGRVVTAAYSRPWTRRSALCCAATTPAK
jgi:hypothetical protein